MAASIWTLGAILRSTAWSPLRTSKVRFGAYAVFTFTAVSGRHLGGENLPLEPGDGRAGGTRVLDAWLLAASVRCGLVGSAAVESSKVDWRWRLQAPGIAPGYWTPDVTLVPSEVRERGISENN